MTVSGRPLDTKAAQPTRNEGDRKFSMNQNLTVLFVWRRTLRIMIEAKRCCICQPYSDKVTSLTVSPRIDVQMRL